jgi:hypothetical protein
MGQIVFFKSFEKRRKTSFATGHSAEILFFTGVRYVPFMGDITPPSSTAPARKGRQRTGLGRKRKRA